MRPTGEKGGAGGAPPPATPESRSDRSNAVIGKTKPKPKEEEQEEEILGEFTEQAITTLASFQFQCGIAFVITLNAMTIGLEQSMQLKNQDTTPIQVVENIFLVIYILELSLRVFAHGWAAFRENWVKFDAMLVASGILNSWIIEPFMGTSPKGLGLLMGLRVARLLRLAKMARLFTENKAFWKLIRGLFSSASIMINTLVVVFIILYVFSSLGVELITKNGLNMGSNPDPDFQEHVSKYFSSLPQTMMTLIQFVTLDDMSLVYKPLIDADGSLALYFVFLILTMSIVLMNVVSAVIIASAFEQNEDEQDDKKRRKQADWLKEDMKVKFARLDDDHTGQLSRENMMNISDEDNSHLIEALGVQVPVQVFNDLDVDFNGMVSINEFSDGIWDVMVMKGDAELKRMDWRLKVGKQVESMHWRLKEAFSLQHETQLSINRILKQMEMDARTHKSDKRGNRISADGESSSAQLLVDVHVQAQAHVKAQAHVQPQSHFKAQPLSQAQAAPSWAQELNDSMKVLLQSLKPIGVKDEVSVNGSLKSLMVKDEGSQRPKVGELKSSKEKHASNSIGSQSSSFSVLLHAAATSHKEAQTKTSPQGEGIRPL